MDSSSGTRQQVFSSFLAKQFSCSSPDQKILVEATAPASTGFILLSSEEQKRGATLKRFIALCGRYQKKGRISRDTPSAIYLAGHEYNYNIFPQSIEFVV